MKKLVIILLVGVLAYAQGAAAQEFIETPTGESIGPPPMEQYSAPAAGSGTRGFGHDPGMGSELPGIELPPSPASAFPSQGQPSQEFPNQGFIPDPISSGDLQPALQPIAQGDESRILGCQPALLESTGTWLRRGFWYSEVDVLLMDRIWRRDNITLAFQEVSQLSTIFGTIDLNNDLTIDGGRSGAEVTPRLKLGRFLFRDHKNRDHAMEFIGYGGGQWSQSGRLDAVGTGTLQVGGYSTLQATGRPEIEQISLDQGNISFDGATSMEYDYDSRFNNFELNYHVKSRMLKDRMELEPSGQWVRRAQPSQSRSFIAGIRYFNLSEDFDWNAFGIDDDNNAATAAQTGNYRVRADNDLIGTQLGFSWTYETARWSLGLKNKSGMYINRTDVESSFEVTGGVTSGDNDIREDNLSFITEGSLIGKWHLRPNFSLRAGLEILYVSSVAHASEQLNFVPVSTSQVVANGDSTYMGGLIGFEGYW